MSHTLYGARQDGGHYLPLTRMADAGQRRKRIHTRTHTRAHTHTRALAKPKQMTQPTAKQEQATTASTFGSRFSVLASLVSRFSAFSRLLSLLSALGLGLCVRVHLCTARKLAINYRLASGNMVALAWVASDARCPLQHQQQQHSLSCCLSPSPSSSSSSSLSLSLNIIIVIDALLLLLRCNHWQRLLQAANGGGAGFGRPQVSAAN